MDEFIKKTLRNDYHYSVVVTKSPFDILAIRYINKYTRVLYRIVDIYHKYLTGGAS